MHGYKKHKVTEWTDKSQRLIKENMCLLTKFIISSYFLRFDIDNGLRYQDELRAFVMFSFDFHREHYAINVIFNDIFTGLLLLYYWDKNNLGKHIKLFLRNIMCFLKTSIKKIFFLKKFNIILNYLILVHNNYCENNKIKS